ncbi:MAG: hypothetical protein WBD47_18020 [Phormidesmis sp.]
MLTSYHYLLSGIAAVSCATTALSQSVVSSQNWSFTPADPAPTEVVDVSYEEETNPEALHQQTTHSEEQEKGPLAHRGSGRVRPQVL